MPVDVINRTLATELEPGLVHLSSKAHQHIAEKHPADYPIVMQHLETAIRAPTFIGQAPKHAGNFELVKRVKLPDRHEYVLVAVSIEADDRGSYRVRSAYLLEPNSVDKRRRTGHLLSPK